jgi:hypothetical protein
MVLRLFEIADVLVCFDSRCRPNRNRAKSPREMLGKSSLTISAKPAGVGAASQRFECRITDAINDARL